ncbi:MAG TPA: carotenoid oxygenase family protein [Nannocystaceae bacterium]|nr:carotenoid oxygenase family protein [Nannocystaceae bacterium]
MHTTATRHYDLDAYNAVIQASPGPLDASIPPSRVDGELPPELQGGTYYLNGPGLVALGGRLMHPFDGHGYVRALTFTEDGGAHLRARFVDTMAYRIESTEGLIRYRGLGTLVGGAFDNLRAPTGKDVANTAVLPWAGRLLALWEGGLPHALDPETLQTIGLESFGGAIAGPYLAHVRVDPQLQHLCGLSPRPGPRATALTFTELDARGRLVRRVDATIPGFAVIHDFAITPSYFIVLGGGVRPDLRGYLRAKFGLGRLIEALTLDPALESTLHLIPRDGGPPIPVGLGRPHLAVHHVSAHERLGEGGAPVEVVLDTCLFDHFTFGHEFGYRGADAPLDPALADPRELQTLRRVRVDLTARRATVTVLGPYCIDFPRLHPDHEGLEYRFAYAAATSHPGLGFPFDAIAKIDVDAAEADPGRGFRLWSPGRGRLCGEPVFAPRPGGASEDEGWILAVIYDGAAAESSLVILDARRVDAGPVAAVPLGALLPYGFHGTWSPPV